MQCTAVGKPLGFATSMFYTSSWLELGWPQNFAHSYAPTIVCNVAYIYRPHSTALHKTAPLNSYSSTAQGLLPLYCHSCCPQKLLTHKRAAPQIGQEIPAQHLSTHTLMSHMALPRHCCSCHLDWWCIFQNLMRFQGPFFLHVSLFNTHFNQGTQRALLILISCMSLSSCILGRPK